MACTRRLFVPITRSDGRFLPDVWPGNRPATSVQERKDMAKTAAADGRFDRRSVLDNAQRLVQQGKVAQAIDAYEQVVRHDPSDWGSANMLGDLLVRAGHSERAIREYVRIADDLANAGFAARAGAIYKKVLRLNPQHAEALRQTESLQVQRLWKAGAPIRPVEEQQVQHEAAPAANAPHPEPVRLIFEATSQTDAIPDPSPA